jgi:hypothetical protein
MLERPKRKFWGKSCGVNLAAERDGPSLEQRRTKVPLVRNLPTIALYSCDLGWANPAQLCGLSRI